ncbi:MAG: RNA 2',3'-cyclic phosphodiesterase [bacterium]
MRTFLAIEIPGQIKRKVDQLITQEKNNRLPMKWIKFENLHITLKFLGEIEESKRREIIPVLERTCKTFTPFSINLEGIGSFPHPGNPRVLWIGVKYGVTVLTSVACEIEKDLGAIGFKKDEHFHAHLTIGRTRKFCKVDSILAKPFISENFPVNSITLFKSTLTTQGSQYEILAKFSLG